MPAKDHSAWDLLPALRHTPGDHPSHHAARRTALLDSPPEILRQELEARARFWNTTPPPDGGPTSPSRDLARRILPWTIAAAVVLGLAWAVWAFGRSAVLDHAPTALLSALLVLLGVYQSSRESHVVRRARTRRCPDCAFDLSGHPGDPPASKLGLNAGPKRCPECGALWPLVPPPTSPNS